ncbi:hypothetical protein U1Q18_002743, partial [Sarracenia purpurea var. burkii]
ANLTTKHSSCKRTEHSSKQQTTNYYYSSKRTATRKKLLLRTDKKEQYAAKRLHNHRIATEASCRTNNYCTRCNQSEMEANLTAKLALKPTQKGSKKWNNQDQTSAPTFLAAAENQEIKLPEGAGQQNTPQGRNLLIKTTPAAHNHSTHLLQSQNLLHTSAQGCSTHQAAAESYYGEHS